MKKCVGCGFCCLMEQCIVSQRLHGKLNQCPELIFKDGRHWCDLVEKRPNLVKDMIGIGCGAHWNLFRKNVKKRTFKEYIDYSNSQLIHDIIGDVAQE